VRIPWRTMHRYKCRGIPNLRPTPPIALKVYAGGMSETRTLLGCPNPDATAPL
jgi:hypothetical protein